MPFSAARLGEEAADCFRQELDTSLGAMETSLNDHTRGDLGLASLDESVKSGHKIHVGCGGVHLPGFINLDVRRTKAVDQIGHAGDLRAFGAGSVETLFCHAVLEHVYAAHLLVVLREWRRVIARDGAVVCLALPNFAAVARQYVSRGPGCTGSLFDLFEAYRQTHGEPEHASDVDWKRFDPVRHAHCGPTGWIPQLHKTLFDPDFVGGLLDESGFCGTIFTYPYPGEQPAINIGFLAQPRMTGSESNLERRDVVDRLCGIPDVARFVNVDTVEIVTWGDGAVRMVRWCKQMEERTPLVSGRVRGVARYLKRLVGSKRR
jgi:hypothetical protein